MKSIRTTRASNDCGIPLFGDLDLCQFVAFISSEYLETYRSAQIDLHHQEREMKRYARDHDANNHMPIRLIYCDPHEGQQQTDLEP